MTQLRVLVVDDKRSAADALTLMLRRGGDDVEAVYDGESAIDRIHAWHPHIVLTDLRMEPVDGLAVLEAARSHQPPAEVIVLTAYGEVEAAVEAMRLGARDFLTKPVPIEQVRARLAALRPDAIMPEPAPRPAPDFIAHAPASQGLFHAIEQAAEVPSPVWLEGEVGSGRGHAARLLHSLGAPDAPFQILDLHRSIVWPSSGVVVLPNVDTLSMADQARLDTALGSVPDAVRLVSLSGPGAAQRVTEGRLRADLYFRLAVLVIPVPALRERADDIIPLFEHALEQFSTRYGRPRPDISPDRAQALRAQAWPGNIRELMNLAERAVVLGDPALNLSVSPAAPAALPSFGAGFSLSAHLEAVERAILVEALKLADGDRAAVGRMLGVERNTLRYKLNKYNLID